MGALCNVITSPQKARSQTFRFLDSEAEGWLRRERKCLHWKQKCSLSPSSPCIVWVQWNAQGERTLNVHSSTCHSDYLSSIIQHREWYNPPLVLSYSILNTDCVFSSLLKALQSWWSNLSITQKPCIHFAPEKAQRASFLVSDLWLGECRASRRVTFALGMSSLLSLWFLSCPSHNLNLLL